MTMAYKLAIFSLGLIAVLYAAAAFTLWDANPANWERSLRTTLVAAWVAGQILAWAITVELRKG